MDNHSQKRRFPYHSEVPSFEVKHRRPEQDPGREHNDPRVYQQPAFDYDTPTNSTDFTKWSVDEIKAFLDRRGGDFDDCNTFEQLVERAIEVEVNTGPAVRPGAAEGAADGDAGANDDLEEWERAEFAVQVEQQAAAAAAAAKTPASKRAGGVAAAAALGASAGGAASAPGGGGTAGGGEDDDEYDPLDAFMAEIDQAVTAAAATQGAEAGRGGRKDDAALVCDEEADPATEYMEVGQ